MGFNTSDFVNKFKSNALKGSNVIKEKFQDKKTEFFDKRKAIKELDNNQLKKIYESRTGKKAEVIQKDFNTGNIINRRPMTRQELEIRIQYSGRISSNNLKPAKKKNKNKSKSVNINLRI